ncbi:hypothetical protein LINGRAPRIM_LOCUS2725, partial [Linum grandiflorum]
GTIILSILSLFLLSVVSSNRVFEFQNLSSLSAFVPSRFQASRPTQDLQSVPLASY